MVALNIALVALTAPKRPVHVPNRHVKTRLTGDQAGPKAPTVTDRFQAPRADTGELKHDIWTG
ncbi:MAG: hypothetical protein FalmKO_05360 [Falsiruegeria mediterranea]